MPHPALKFEQLQPMPGSTLLLALTGWMDGGNVSTGTVRQFMQGRKLVDAASIRPGGFYIDNFPGSMEIAAVFRPEVKYVDGLIESFEVTKNSFFADVPANMLFFIGREPNLDWTGFGDCIFEVVRQAGVNRIVFMGSFGGAVPHTREPRLFGSVSSKTLLPVLSRFGLTPSTYEGPASFATYLLHHAPRMGVDMISIAAEIPGYLQGHNPLSIAAVSRRLAAMLEIEVDLESLRRSSTEWEIEVSEQVEKDDELAEQVKKLEAQYDDELVEGQS